MNRSRRSKKKNIHTKRFLIFFTAGIIAGTVIFFMFKVYTPQIYKITKKAPAPRKILHTPMPPAPARYKIAIVLDDFGYNYKNVEALISMKRPVTFSILPHLAYSKAIARRVHQKGFEAILHLPLEARKGERSIRPEVNTITIDMKQEDVLARLSADIENTPYIKGVSGHQGSKATEDGALMRIIFTELKKRNLFFLDSLVSSKSVCKKIAKETGIGFGKRDIFLDNKEDITYIRGQMQQLVKRARKNGFAVGIGHDRDATVAALVQLMPEAEKEGVEFVSLSELIK